jgi:hypothetical protein
MDKRRKLPSLQGPPRRIKLYGEPEYKIMKSISNWIKEQTKNKEITTIIMLSLVVIAIITYIFKLD